MSSEIGRRWFRSRAVVATMPSWGQVALLYLASRVYTLLVVSVAARYQAPTWMNQPDPGYLGMVSMWDGYWYQRIAADGYPPQLPVGNDGEVVFNEWAFYPLFPLSVRVLGSVLGTDWPVTATLFSATCGLGAVLLMHRLLRATVGDPAALWAVALFCFFPSAPVLQMAYTEGLGALLLMATFWGLYHRKYLLVAAIAPLIGLTRPIGVPVAAVVLLHVIRRLRSGAQDRVTGREWPAVAIMLSASAASGLLWPFIVSRAVGEPDAYLRTMASWRADIERTTTPFLPWHIRAEHLVGGFALALLIALVVLVVVVLRSRAAAALDPDHRAWAWCYLGYLAAVLDPTTSLVRYLLLAFPLGTIAVLASGSTAYRRLLLVVAAASQILWVFLLWRFVYPVTPPLGPP